MTNKNDKVIKEFGEEWKKFDYENIDKDSNISFFSSVVMSIS